MSSTYETRLCTPRTRGPDPRGAARLARQSSGGAGAQAGAPAGREQRTCVVVLLLVTRKCDAASCLTLSLSIHDKMFTRSRQRRVAPQIMHIATPDEQRPDPDDAARRGSTV